MQGTKVSEEITVAGQVTKEQLHEAVQNGFRSVLNLRDPDETGVLEEEKEIAESEGLFYLNLPVRKERISESLTTQILAEIDRLPKPALIHCASGIRAGAMVFMHLATRQGLSAEEAMNKAQSLGFDCSHEPELKQFFEHYIESQRH